MKTSLFLISAFILSSCSVGNVEDKYYHYLTVDINEMNTLKSGYEKGNPDETAYVKTIISDADAEVSSEKIYTITGKEILPPSGDRHDYISMAPYWWPDTVKNDGSFVYLDGKFNPISRKKYTDQATLAAMCKAVKSLGYAYFFTQNDTYVERASQILECFFIDEETRMNPNLDYTQFIPGQNEGTCFGIIETEPFLYLMESIALMHNSTAWNKELHNDLKSWFSKYLEWLLTSKNGMKERTRLNNHGTHYDVQCVSMYLFCDSVTAAADYLRKYTLPRIEQQVAADGSQPKELARTKSWNYSTMNLGGFVNLALLADKCGVDLWHYQKNGQVYMRSMIDWFVPFLKKEKPWEWKQIIKSDVKRIKRTLEVASEVYADSSYLELSKQLVPLNDMIIGQQD